MSSGCQNRRQEFTTEQDGGCPLAGLVSSAISAPLREILLPKA